MDLPDLLKSSVCSWLLRTRSLNSAHKLCFQAAELWDTLQSLSESQRLDKTQMATALLSLLQHDSKAPSKQKEQHHYYVL